MKKLAVAAFLAATVTLGFSNAYAAEAESLLEGLSINGGITLILQSLQKSNVSTATEIGYETPTVGSYSVDLEIEKKFDDNNTAFLHLETGTGDANSRFTAFSGINRDADDSGNQVSVTEAWFEHKFTDSFGMTFGVIDPTSSLDDNAYANDETSQFLGDIFRNAPVISFGDNAIGIKAVYETDFIDVAAQYLNVENTIEIGPDEEINNDDITRHGFVSAQVNFKPGFIEDMEGNYRIYAWGLLDGGVKWEDGENTTDYGFGVSIDQQISDIFGVFARYSWKRDDAYSSTIGTFDGDYASPCNQTWSIGAQAKINALGEEDIVGLAFGQMMISDKAKDTYGYDFKAEDHLEVYYSWNISDYLAVTPSIQYVNNVCGGAAEDMGADNSAFVGSIRMQISF